MCKKVFRLFALSFCLLVSGGVCASVWDLWADEDEELNMKSPSYTIKRKNEKSASRLSKTSITGKAGSSSFKPIESAGSIGYNPDESFFDINSLDNKKPIVVCRHKGCTELNDKMTRNYLFNVITIKIKSKEYAQNAN